MSRETHSEKLFELYCIRRNYTFEKVMAGSGRTPDYKIDTPSGYFFCEVTQIEPNEDDKKWLEEVMRNGGSWNSSRPCADMAKKIRNRLKDKFKRKQLNAYAEKGFPTLLVIFDATGRFYLDPFTLAGAMYGDQRAWISSDKNEPPIFEHGGNRQFRQGIGTHISAVAILNSDPSLEILHNPFSEVPFPPELLFNPLDKHFVKQRDTRG